VIWCTFSIMVLQSSSVSVGNPPPFDHLPHCISYALICDFSTFPYLCPGNGCFPTKDLQGPSRSPVMRSSVMRFLLLVRGHPPIRMSRRRRPRESQRRVRVEKKVQGTRRKTLWWSTTRKFPTKSLLCLLSSLKFVASWPRSKMQTCASGWSVIFYLGPKEIRLFLGDIWICTSPITWSNSIGVDHLKSMVWGGTSQELKRTYRQPLR